MKNSEIPATEIYRLLFENSMDAVFITDPSGKIYEANPAAEKMLGWNEEEICSLGRNGILDLTDPDLSKFLLKREAEGQNSGRVRLRRKDGTIVTVEITSSLFQLLNGDTRSYIIARDISQQKKKESLITAAFEFNEKVLSAAPIGIAIYHNNGKCLYVNDYFAETVGASKSQLLIQNFRKIKSWHNFGLYPFAEQVLSDGVEIHREIHVVTSFGKDIWMDMTFTSFVYANENHLLLMIYNITERKKSEELLKESEEKFRTSVEGMLDPFAIFESVKDPEGNITDFKIKYINSAAQKIFNILAGKKTAERFLDIFPEPNRREFFYDFCDLVNSGKPLNKETIIYDPATGIDIMRALNVSAVKLGDGFVFSSRDITESKIIEQKLRELNESKDKFFSIIAHDLRSPFHSILGITQILAEEPDSLTPEEVKKVMQASSLTVKNTFKLLEDLLQWANNQTGRITFDPVNFSLEEIVLQALSVFYTVAKEKDISLVYDDGSDTIVYGDVNMFDTVIRNLLSNAIKFTPKGGTINIIITPREKDVEISVSDNGVGISEENINKIFNLGDKLSTPGTNNEKGTGLGLVLCKDFIERNNGTLKIESEPGKGSTVSFIIPYPPSPTVYR